MDALDAERLRAELAALDAERREVNMRIRDLDPLGGRGAGRGPFGRGMPGPGGRGMPFRDGPPPHHEGGGFDSRRPPLGRPPFDRPMYNSYGEHDVRFSGEEHMHMAPLEPPPRPTLASSAVAVGGDAAEGGGGEGGTRKRPAGGELLEDKPDVKRRNRRMFGNIMGTLQRFKEDEEKASRSDVAQRRAEILQRSQRKKEEEAQKLRQAAAQERQAVRQEQYGRKREINAQSDIKRLELMYAQKLARHDKLLPYLRTATQPSLYWAPAQHSAPTHVLQEARRQEHLLWKDQQLQQCEEEKEAILERMRNPLPRRVGPGGQVQGGEGQGGEEGAEDEEMGEGEEGEGTAQQAQQQQQEGKEGMAEGGAAVAGAAEVGAAEEAAAGGVEQGEEAEGEEEGAAMEGQEGAAAEQQQEEGSPAAEGSPQAGEEEQ